MLFLYFSFTLTILPSFMILLYLIHNFPYSFLAVPGLHCCLGLLCSCSEQGLLASCSVLASHCGGFSYCGAQALDCEGFSSRGSRALERRLSSWGAQA